MVLHEQTPDLIEWEEVDKLFNYWFDEIYKRSNPTCIKDQYLLQCMVKYVERGFIPRVIVEV